MQKGPLIGISIIAVVLLVLGSLTNVVGYQVVQFSNQKTIKDDNNQKELLFQTILDIVNNKEVQNIIQKSESRRSPISFLHVPSIILLLIKSRISYGVLLSLSSALTKSYLEYTYNRGVRLSKTLSVSKIHSILERFRVNSREMQKKITEVIKKNSELNKGIEQLSDLPCNCENGNKTLWYPPILCIFLFILLFVALGLYMHGNPFGEILGNIVLLIIDVLNCPF